MTSTAGARYDHLWTCEVVKMRPHRPWTTVTGAVSRLAGLGIVVTLTFLVSSTAAAMGREQPDTTFGSGILQVGKDVAPGTYQTVVPDNSIGCYWARLSDLSGDLDGILANANLEPGDMATVTIKPSDVGFESTRCGTWKPSAEVGPATPATSFGGGTWIVGEDIQAGTYRTTVPEQAIGCYWARLSDLSGDLDGILANANLEAGDRVTVVIARGDAGFTAQGCGTWEKAG